MSGKVLKFATKKNYDLFELDESLLQNIVQGDTI